MFPITHDILSKVLGKLEIPDVASATIRQIVAVSNELEKEADEKFIHLELGNPGLPPETIGIEAECEALRKGVAKNYPDISGIPQVKEAGSRFIKAFLDVDVPASCVVPTTGSMQGSFSLMLLLKRRLPGKDTLLMLYPGFSAQRHQAKLLDMNIDSFDIYEYRGKKMEEKLEEKFKSGKITAMIYSNPNNPAWTNLTDEELEIIGRLATKYDVIVLEDLAYLGMDFRKNYGIPYEAPYVPTVAKYTDNYILLLSASKIFSYAGQRIAMVAMSDKVYHRHYQSYADFFEMPALGDAFIYGVLYCCSSGTTHSAQYGFAAMLNAAVDGKLNFVDHCSEYGRRAGAVKKIFLDNGFNIVYSMDGDREIGDGFFFTVGYKNMPSDKLQSELMRYGVSSVSLPSTGSEQNGIRVTVSTISDAESFKILNERLQKFNADFSK
ncbi:MAG: pyridoxal phosphate-dependent aminotransferase [Muribaculaceae bacterium]|nr:pyridoxal phosphate-dependent aminotransferase [Muribaculaceae bacterium]